MDRQDEATPATRAPKWWLLAAVFFGLVLALLAASVVIRPQALRTELEALDRRLTDLEIAGAPEYSADALMTARAMRSAIDEELDRQRHRPLGFRSYDRARELLEQASDSAAAADNELAAGKNEARDAAVERLAAATRSLTGLHARLGDLKGSFSKGFGDSMEVHLSEYREQIEEVQTSITIEAYRRAQTEAEALRLSVEEMSDELLQAGKLKSRQDSPRTGEPQRQPAQAVWNVWWEQPSPKNPTFDPLPRLSINQPYTLVVDLGKLAFGSDPGLSSRSASRSLRKALSELEADSTSIQVLLLPDGEHFEPVEPSERVKWLPIDLKRLREEQLTLDLGGRSPMEALRAGQGADIDLGSQVFQLTTTGAAGVAQVGLSFWVDKRPVDELSLSVCVSPCSEEPTSKIPLASINLRGIDFENRVPMPDAALHFVELGRSELIGVFRCNKCEDWEDDEFRTWRLENSLTSLEARVLQEVLPALHEESTEESLIAAGQALFDALFASRDRAANHEAEASIGDFVQQAPSATAESAAPPWTMFVRLLPADTELAYPIPMDLMWVPTGLDSGVFLGTRLIVVSPLEFEDYSVSSTCISSWSLLVPPASETGSDRPLKEARSQITKWIDVFRQAAKLSVLCQAPDCFRAWLGVDPVPPPSPVAMLTLSHHVSGRLCFSDFECLGSSVRSSNIRRSFGSPSVAIIAACGTAKPGATAFLRRFNLHGVSTAIATSTTVNARMAGSFLARLFEVLEENAGNESFTLARAKFEAVRRLTATARSDKPAETRLYGSRALVFSLLGNGQVRVCLPDVTPRLEG